MNNQRIPISMAEADPFAIEYFMKICGLNREGEKYQRMLKQGMDIKERIQDRVNLQAVVSSFPGDVIHNNVASINGISFECNAFQQLKPQSIIRIYAYILTAGDFELDQEAPIIEQLYADIWGTAYVDASLEVLKEYLIKDLAEDTETRISTYAVLDSFGPGFYGMEVDQVGNFFELLDGDQIGVKARTNSLMLPLKSCTGLFVAVDDETQLPASDCKNCHAAHNHCEFCHAVVRGKQ